MAGRGYVKLWRSIVDMSNWPANQRRSFTEFEAFIDLYVVLASGTDSERPRGQLEASQRALAKRWRWSHAKVRRVLAKFQREGLIEVSTPPSTAQATHQPAQLTICKYETWNPTRHPAPGSTPEPAPEPAQLNDCKKKECEGSPAPGSTPEPAPEPAQNKRKRKEREKKGSASSPSQESPSRAKLIRKLGQIYTETLKANTNGSGNLPLKPIRALRPDSKRWKHCNARLFGAGREPEEFLRDFAEAVDRACRTPFLLGDNERGWRANFDWLVGSADAVDWILEGKYDNPGPASSSRSQYEEKFRELD